MPTVPSAPPPADEVTKNKRIARGFKYRADASRTHRHDLIAEWKRNVEGRLGLRSAVSAGGLVGIDTDDSQASLNPDWALTKAKTANLYSQVPMVRCTHENVQYAPAVPPFTKALNYELSEKRANVGVAMEEVLNDVVNASGIGAIYVGYEARFESKEVPRQDSLIPAAESLAPPEPSDPRATSMMAVPVPVSARFTATRLSPASLLWPRNFQGSNFDDADWLGFEGEMSWAQAKIEFKLTDDQKDEVLAGGDPTSDASLQTEDREWHDDVRRVQYTTLFYWRYRVDPDELSLQAIWKLVYVKGIERAVVHAPWEGQQPVPQTYKYVGISRYPIRVLTLTYISDHPVPPSDSAAGRPQVRDLQRSRSQMFQNREHSRPLRWYDVNRIDADIQMTLMRGTPQGMIPTNGDGTRCIGEIARASYPAEDLAFDNAAKTDLMESWALGPNQLGSMSSTGRKTKAEVETVQANFSTSMGRERARVALFFLSLVEVIAGWMALYSDFPTLTEQERTVMQQAWDSRQILHELVLKIRPDSTIVLDSEQRLQRLVRFLNLVAKSGYVNVAPIIAEMAELSGLDPATIMIQPEQKPKEPQLSFRFSGKDDLTSPVVMALMLEKGLSVKPESLDAAKQLLMAALAPPKPPEVQGPGGGGPAGPGPRGASGQAPGGPPRDANAQWEQMPKVATRSREIGGA